MKKVLITGKGGMLANRLELILSAHGYTVTALDQSACDITNIDSITHAFARYAPDICINAAAYNAVDLIEEDDTAFDLAKQVNAQGPKNLAHVSSEHACLLMHYSTDYIFDGQKKEGYQENDIPHAISRYATTKILGEENVQSNTSNYYIIRLSRLFGTQGTGEGSKRSFVEMILGLYNDGKRDFDIVDEEVSCPTYADDLVAFTQQLIEDMPKFGIYHGANEGACTWYQFAQEFFRMKNIEDAKLTPVTSHHYQRPAARPAYSELLNTKREKQRSWQEALNEYIKKSDL